LKLVNFAERLSNFAFNFHLRRCSTGLGAAHDLFVRLQPLLDCSPAAVPGDCGFLSGCGGGAGGGSGAGGAGPGAGGGGAA